ncbi:DUF779 domain-containing protein [Kytococcus sp. Marseille-QA3725]
MSHPPVVAMPAGIALLRRILARHGPVMLHQSGGCCDGLAPMCYRDGEFRVGQRDAVRGSASTRRRGERLLTRSRVFEPAELEALEHAVAPTGAQVEAGHEPPLPGHPTMVTDMAEACPLPLRR